MNDWKNHEVEPVKLREARIYADGFWAGAAMMGLVAIAAVMLAISL